MTPDTSSLLVSIDIVDGVATVTVDNPPVNALSHSVRVQLLDAIQQTETNPAVNSVILTCNGRTFIAGADIREFDQPAQTPHLPDVIDQLSACEKPWIAVLHGTVLGGGLEVALGCHYRLADKGCKVGFPEVNLGLIPGAGGTVRLPRLVGIENALDLIVSGKPIDMEKAFSLGIVDEIINGDRQESALAFTQSLTRNPTRKSLSSIDTPPVNDENAFNEKLDKLRHKWRFLEAQTRAIELIAEARSLSYAEAQSKEREIFLRLKKGHQSAALRYLFKAERSVSRLTELNDVKPVDIEHVGIIGAGTMGSGIAASCLLAGLSVVIVERRDDALAHGMEKVGTILDDSVKRGLVSEKNRRQMLSRFQGATDLSALATLDLVIEAVFEDMAVKKELFGKLAELTRPSTLLASNTSYLDIDEIAAESRHPERVLGLHFFSPAHVMKLLEVVMPHDASPQTIASGIAFGKRLKKITVPAGVGDGFIGNRIMASYRRACDEMLEDGAMPDEIDSAMRNFGFAMGIYQVQDLAGLDIAWAMRKRQAATRDPAARYVRIADRLCEAERFGRKSGKGWYDYSNKLPVLDQMVKDLIIAESHAQGINRRSFSDEEIMRVILTTMQHEAQAVLDEGIARSAEAIDVVMVNGYGFPRWKGGPMFMRDEHPSVGPL